MERDVRVCPGCGVMAVEDGLCESCGEFVDDVVKRLPLHEEAFADWISRPEREPPPEPRS